MTTFIIAVITLLGGFAVGLLFRRILAALPADADQQSSLAPSVNQPGDESGDLYKIAESLQSYFDQSAHPKDMLSHAEFERGIKLLSSETYSTADLLNYVAGTNGVICCMALEALARRETVEQDIFDPIINLMPNLGYWPVYFAFHALAKHTSHPQIGPVMARVNLAWRSSITIQLLREFIEARIAAGEKPDFGDELNLVTEDDQAENLETALREIGEPLVGRMLEQTQQHRLSLFLRGIGSIWSRDAEPRRELLIEHDYLIEQVNEVESAIQKKIPHSVLLVGESGVGKTALVRALARRLQQEGWMIFESSANELTAGQVFIGELEGRIQNLLRQLSRQKKVLWFVPNFQDLLWAGQHKYQQAGVLDQIFSRIESGEIVMLGETQPAAYERLLQAKPRVRTTLETVRVHSLNDEKTLALARQWVEHYSLSQRSDDDKLIANQTLSEAFQLSKQFLGEKASPGNLLQFLSLTRQRLAALNPDASFKITLDDLLVTLSQLTGLPLSILDDRHGLDLDALRDYFQSRVLGQPEAVDCLIERVAMIKAGVTDPKRPQGVFLFAGPTGTGKTEIAKTLARFLFGSEERMIRIDMSELQTGSGLGRLIGETEEVAGQTALVNQIRRQPFSVILLDEFEKADISVWDLFLQVFDDGRLTDRRGYTADFRHSIIILTSNLGAAIPHGMSVGFQDTAGFSQAMVERTIGKTFRREFVNRLDRVVIFRPLNRGVMRDLLKKELRDVVHRRGLRNRDWAVEWDESALEFLLDKGFTPDLGARPLKRAIEQYLLSPLAMSIVNHQLPDGDQFLFVRSDGKAIQVEFVDPNPPEAPAATGEETDAECQLEEIALDARGTPAEVEFLKDAFERLVDEIESEDWQAKKNSALLQTSAKGFWNSPARFSVLGLVEYMDRIEVGLRSGDSLLRRILGTEPEKRKLFSSDLTKRLAQQIYLLEIACDDLADSRPREAFLQVESGRDTGLDPTESDVFAQQLIGMYEQWAAKRKMKLEVIEQTTGNDRQPLRWLATVSGYGAFSILAPEAGFHVLETPRKEGNFNRFKARVRVADMPDEPVGDTPGTLARLARESFDRLGDKKLVIVRRYRETPSPLVRDSIRNWRTGKLDRVLGGDFDLIR
ncbi:MAG: AAA family ATPase [Acidobacteriota bacterium]|nr:AAA family ATPase [Acidobacteriota bacterium]